MSDYFGFATFKRPVVLVSDLPGELRGYTRQTIDGRIVYVYIKVGRYWTYEHQPFVAEWEFERQPWSVVRNLRTLWRGGNICGFRLDSITGRGSLALEDGLTNITHYTGQKVPYQYVRGTHNDKWNGKIKILVQSAYDGR